MGNPFFPIRIQQQRRLWGIYRFRDERGFQPAMGTGHVLPLHGGGKGEALAATLAGAFGFRVGDIHFLCPNRSGSVAGQRREMGSAFIADKIQKKWGYGKEKIQCIYGSPYVRLQVLYGIVKIPMHRRILGENIRMYRRTVKWSQEKLAEKADLHHNYIGDIERGEENVSVDALMRIATALKVRLRDLVRDV